MTSLVIDGWGKVILNKILSVLGVQLGIFLNIFYTKEYFGYLHDLEGISLWILSNQFYSLGNLITKAFPECFFFLAVL